VLDDIHAEINSQCISDEFPTEQKNPTPPIIWKLPNIIWKWPNVKQLSDNQPRSSYKLHKGIRAKEMKIMDHMVKQIQLVRKYPGRSIQFYKDEMLKDTEEELGNVRDIHFYMRNPMNHVSPTSFFDFNHLSRILDDIENETITSVILEHQNPDDEKYLDENSASDKDITLPTAVINDSIPNSLISILKKKLPNKPPRNFQPYPFSPLSEPLLLMNPVSNKRILRRANSDSYLFELRRCFHLTEWRHSIFPLAPDSEIPPTRCVDDSFKPPSATYDPTSSPNLFLSIFTLDSINLQYYIHLIGQFDPPAQDKWELCDRKNPIRTTFTLKKSNRRDIHGRKLRRKHLNISGSTIFPTNLKKTK